MLSTHLRHAAAVLLESAVRIAPPDAREWGQAMRGELNHVEDPWAALTWALGGASVLARRALASLFIPGRRGQSIPPGAGLFAKDVSIRRAALAAGGACILAALIFFAAPPFRQALRVALSPWIRMLQSNSGDEQPRLEALARRAEQGHDAEGLAFCAVRLRNARDSARLADEAVRLDPSLLWVYAVVAVRHPDLPEASQWVPKLEHWDPGNALFPLITAETEDIRKRGHEKDLVWQSALAAAFRSPEFDDYLDRVEKLDRRVVPRYRFYDPEAVLFEVGQGIPSYAVEDCRWFASSLVRSGEDFEARGDVKRAMEEYWAVARFGQLIDSQVHPGLEHLAGASLQAMAYQQLRALSAREGDTGEAALFAYLGRKVDPATGEHERLQEGVFGKYISRRNAAVLKISSLMMLIFSGLLVVAASVLIAGSRRGGRSVAQRFRPGATVVALTSAVGLLLSSATVYLTYRPYWYIFQGAILKGDARQTEDLRSFLMATRTLPGLKPYNGLLLNFPFYFWTGVTLLDVIGLILILLRHFRWLARLRQVQPDPRV